jgi:hypothetical protein
VVFVFPDDDLVLALNGGGTMTGNSRDAEVVMELRDTYVRGAIRSDSSLPPDPVAVTLLRQRLHEAAVSDDGPPQPVPDLPQTASQVSGRTYRLEANSFGFSTLRLSFSPESDEALLEATIPAILGETVLQVAIGLDGVSRFSQGLFDLTIAAKGWWETDDTFVALIDNIGLISLWRYSLTFSGDLVELRVDCLAGYQPSANMIIGFAE